MKCISCGENHTLHEDYYEDEEIEPFSDHINQLLEDGWTSVDREHRNRVLCKECSLRMSAVELLKVTEYREDGKLYRYFGYSSL